ncbi:DUF6558 family protein [Planococcus sp. SIMBA_143]
MIISTGFYYDNEYSGDKNVFKAFTSGGAVTETFLSSTNNSIFKPRNLIKSVVQSTEREPLVIPMALYFDENLDDDNIRAIKKWLYQKDFKELVFEDQPEKVFYAKVDGAVNLSHNAIASGYIEFDFIANSAYSFSRMIELEGQSESIEEYQTLHVYNEGDLITHPKITITMNANEATDIEFYNATTNEQLIIKNTLADEKVMILNEYGEFETSSNLRYVYDDHIGDFISFAEGVNELQIKGEFTYTIEYQNIYL